MASKEIKPVVLKEINPEYSLEGLMLKLKLKLKYFGQLIGKDFHAGERLKAGGQGDDRE